MAQTSPANLPRCQGKGDRQIRRMPHPPPRAGGVGEAGEDRETVRRAEGRSQKVERESVRRGAHNSRCRFENDLWMAFGHLQEHFRRSGRAAPALFPILQSA